MKSLVLSLFYTKKGLNILDEEFEDDLFRKSILIFSVYGIVKFIFDFKPEEEGNRFILNLIYLFGSLLASVIVGMFFSFFLYKIGKWIGGKAKYIKIFSLLAYSYFPIIIGLIMVGLMKRIEHIEIIIYLSWIFSIKILFLGLVKFNEYGLKKALLNLVVLIGLFFILNYLHPYLLIK